MARRFHRGGRLVVFADGGSETDVAHVVVEFVHPVIVGKRALPAFALAAPDQAAQLELFAGPSDIALGISADDAGAPTPTAPTVPVTLAAAARIGLLTVALLGGVGPVPDGLADHVLVVRSADPLVVKEMQVTTYHVLWELVHVFLDQPGLL
jgi:D-sedoheptulose 7-phosphate isomerase